MPFFVKEASRQKGMTVAGHPSIIFKPLDRGVSNDLLNLAGTDAAGANLHGFD
jgi:hypothetical protein